MNKTASAAFALITVSLLVAACGAGTGPAPVVPYDGPLVAGGRVPPRPASRFWPDVIESHYGSSAGRIYFYESPPGLTRSVDTDGGGAIDVFLPAKAEPLSIKPGGGNMTHKRHGGVYWIVAARDTGSINPDGSPTNCLVARRDDGAGGTYEVQLSVPQPGGERLGGLALGSDDSYIGFKSVRWSGGAVTGQFFRAALTWNPVTGDPVLGYAYPLLDFSSFLYTNSAGWLEYLLLGHTWSPDGTEIAYSLNGEIIRADLSSNPPTLTTVAFGIAPHWSPDGARIVFRDGSTNIDILGGSLYVVPASGGTPTKLVDEVEIQVPLARVLWSPDGQFVAFTHRGASLGIAFVPASGGPILFVVDDPSKNESLIGWRPD